MATLFRQPNSPFWFVCYQVAGKTVRRSTKVRHNGRNEPQKGSQALQILAAIEAREAMRRFGIDGPEAYEDMPISNFAEQFISAMVDRREPTRARYGRYLRAFLRWCETESAGTLHQIDTALGSRYFDHRKQLLAGNTVRSEMAFLASMMEDAKRKKNVTFQQNPFRDHKLIVAKKEEVPFTTDEIRVLLSMECPPWAQIATRIALYTGARGDSIRHLRWEDVDWKQRTIYWPKTKTDAYASPMPALLIEYLRPKAGEGLVMPEVLSKKKPGYFGGMWVNYAKRAGLVGAHFHRLRHTYNTALAHAGVDRATRQLLCNHKSSTVNAAYTHADASLLVSAVDGLAFG